MQLSDYEQKSIEAFEKSVNAGKWSNDGLVSLLKVITDDYLRLQKISTVAKEAKKTTQWVRQSKNVVKIDNVQFIPNNF